MVSRHPSRRCWKRCNQCRHQYERSLWCHFEEKDSLRYKSMHTTAKRPNALRKILLVDDSQLSDALSTWQVTLTFGSAGKARVESLHQSSWVEGKQDKAASVACTERCKTTWDRSEVTNRSVSASTRTVFPLFAVVSNDRCSWQPNWVAKNRDEFCEASWWTFDFLCHVCLSWCGTSWRNLFAFDEMYRFLFFLCQNYERRSPELLWKTTSSIEPSLSGLKPKYVVSSSVLLSDTEFIIGVIGTVWALSHAAKQIGEDFKIDLLH